jgi:sugar O-acyltransferase (sialic acid O-acetyltransferase NeuD family)
MQNLIIYGNGRIAKIVYQFVKDNFNVVAFTVDELCIEEERIEGLPLLPFENIENEYSVLDHKILIAVGYVGMNNIREKKYLEAIEKGYSFVNYIHPSVHMHDNIHIGENNIILDNVSLQPYSEIGNSNFIWSNAVIAHGTNVGDTNWITSGVVVSGDAVIKSKCFLGVNATIGHNTILDDETFIGANTLVTKNTKKREVFISKEGEYFRLDSLRFLQFTGV